MKTKRVKSGLYSVTLDNGREYTIRRRVDRPSGYWGDWEVRGPGMGFRGTLCSSKRRCMAEIENAQHAIGGRS